MTRPQPLSRKLTNLSRVSSDRFQAFSIILMRVIVLNTVMVEIVTSKHHGQNALITKKLCESNQSAKIKPAP